MPIPLIEQARRHPQDLAVSAADGEFTYGDLLESSQRVAAGLLNVVPDLAGQRVAFLAPPPFTTQPFSGGSGEQVPWPYLFVCHILSPSSTM